MEVKESQVIAPEELLASPTTTVIESHAEQIQAAASEEYEEDFEGGTGSEPEDNQVASP